MLDPPRLEGFPVAPGWLIVPTIPLGRQLTGPEIIQLEANGCSAPDWSQVLVSKTFDPDRLRQVEFLGWAVLGSFGGTVSWAGVDLPAGIYNATVANCRISSNARIANVGLLASISVGEEALVANCDEVIHVEGSSFGNGVRVGLHAANAVRSLRVVADLPFSVLSGLVRPRLDQAAMDALDQRLERYTNACLQDSSIIGARARVTGCRRISGSYIGPRSIVSGATTVFGSTLLSDADDVARIGAGAIVRQSLLQWNAVVEDNAYVEDSLICEAATVTRHGIVTRSAVGPNTRIAEGEVNNSVIGPFVGFNHQSLLVSACWPEGRGNIGYGANVGSNHTGRAPDQEIHPGEGVFIGLGVNIKMPTDFSEAPYTIVATAVNTLPQRLTMPFSLIVPGQEPGGLNRLYPGWGLARNLYGLARNTWKFGTRNRATRAELDPDVFRDVIMAQVERAHDELEALPDQAYYTEGDLPGLGKNYVDAPDLKSGIAAYASTLRWYGLRQYFRAWESSTRPPAIEDFPLLERFSAARQPGLLFDLYLRAEKDRLSAILTSKATDDTRGAKTIEDYSRVNTPAADDPIYLWASDEFDAVAERVAVLRTQV